MLLERYYDDPLAQASYLIGCEAAGQAIVIDPLRDPERYLRAAAAKRVRIAFVAETHIHADFLSGSPHLARAARATLVLSDEGGDEWRYRFGEDARRVRDGDVLEIGRVRLQVLHTPGHTPEHICFLVTDTATGERPMGLISGDFLFVGDVGRPDLLERAARQSGTMERAARQLHASLRRLKEFPDYLQVWPGHGAGSACGKSLGAVPQTTLGYERLYNPALQHDDEAAFVRWVLADQPEPPRYFARMKQLNRDGPPAPPDRDLATLRLDADAVRRARDAGHWVLDLRGSKDFAQRHLAGTINIPGARTFLSYAGTVLTEDRPVVILAASPDQAMDAARQLALIGVDDVAGWATTDVIEQLARSAGEEATLPLIEPRALAEQLRTNGPRVVDVRNRTEWREGHLPTATHIFLGDLESRLAELKRDEPIVVHCASGTRSSIGASLLRARGFRDVSNLAGGFAAWQKQGLPVARDD